MSKHFLFSSTVLFLGGVVLLLSGLLSGAAFLSALSILLMLMGGVPLLCLWFRELVQLLNKVYETPIGSDKENPS